MWYITIRENKKSRSFERDFCFALILLICFAPIYHFGCGFSANGTNVCNVFLFKGHAAGRNACNFFKLFFTFAVAAPHGFDEAVAAVCDIDEFVKVVSGESAVFTVFESFLIKSVANELEKFRNLGFEFVEGYEIFFFCVVFSPEI